MNTFENIRFEAENGIYFFATIDEITQLFFLDISLLEDMSTYKRISYQSTALAAFRACQSNIYRMAINALKQNPHWDRNTPLSLLKSYLK